MSGPSDTFRHELRDADSVVDDRTVIRGVGDAAPHPEHVADRRPVSVVAVDLWREMVGGGVVEADFFLLDKTQDLCGRHGRADTGDDG